MSYPGEEFWLQLMERMEIYQICLDIGDITEEAYNLAKIDVQKELEEEMKQAQLVSLANSTPNGSDTESNNNETAVGPLKSPLSLKHTKEGGKNYGSNLDGFTLAQQKLSNKEITGPQYFEWIA